MKPRRDLRAILRRRGARADRALLLARVADAAQARANCAIRAAIAERDATIRAAVRAADAMAATPQNLLLEN